MLRFLRSRTPARCRRTFSQQHKQWNSTIATDYNGQPLKLETGKLAPLVDGAIVASYGDTTVFATAVYDKRKEPEAADFLPLSVDYREKGFAAGVIPTTYKRREGPSSDVEVLHSRIIDRSIRPMFPKGYSRDTQVVCNLWSHDPTCSVDTINVLAASAALSISPIPWPTPIASLRVGWINGEPVLNPSNSEMEDSQLDLLLSGTHDRIVMIETAAVEIDENDYIAALQFGQQQLQPLITIQKDFQEITGKEKLEDLYTPPTDTMKEAALKQVYLPVIRLLTTPGLEKQVRGETMANMERTARERMQELFPNASSMQVSEAVAGAQNAAVRDLIRKRTKSFSDIIMAMPASSLKEAVEESYSHLESTEEAAVEFSQESQEAWEARRSDALACVNDIQETFEADLKELEDLLARDECRRADGRDANEVRQINCETALLPRVHGSSLFSRGVTQSLCTVTLGPPSVAPTFRPVSDEAQKKHFFLHYDFPPYSINEVGRLNINRRMIGHGALAEKALRPLVPSPEEYPFTIRVTSEVLGSDGSSSMATVAGASLALFDAGVPLDSHVAGVAMGLVTPRGKYDYDPSDEDYMILTDILGLEDHHTDMDFKVAGTKTGITGVQLDMKLPGVRLKPLIEAIKQSRPAREHILAQMHAAIPEPREQTKEHAPKLEYLSVPMELRGAVIGPGGWIIKNINAKSGASVNLDGETGLLEIFGRDAESVEVAKTMVQEAIRMAHPGAEFSAAGEVFISEPEPLQVGEEVEATVHEIRDYGAILAVKGVPTGLLHISELEHYRVGQVRDILQDNDTVKVKVLDIDAQGRVKFSRRALIPKPDTSSSKPSTASSSSPARVDKKEKSPQIASSQTASASTATSSESQSSLPSSSQESSQDESEPSELSLALERLRARASASKKPVAHTRIPPGMEQLITVLPDGRLEDPLDLLQTMTLKPRQVRYLNDKPQALGFGGC